MAAFEEETPPLVSMSRCGTWVRSIVTARAQDKQASAAAEAEPDASTTATTNVAALLERDADDDALNRYKAQVPWKS
jgi:hypothetical protein